MSSSKLNTFTRAQIGRFLVLCLTFLISSRSEAVQTVNFVDLNRYSGKWFEIASIPAWFQKKCVKNTTAEYRGLDFNRIDVINTCEKSDGSSNVANGIAHIADTETQADLRVSFVPFFNFFGWFSGQYKIIALGESYDYSLVGDDTLRFGWILARTPTLSVETLVRLEKKIASVGYDSCKFQMSIQDGGAATVRIPLCEFVKTIKP